jgi:uncharacterized protein (DUF1330 family)
MANAAPVLLVVWIDVNDAALYARYADQVPATVHKYGGRYLARGPVIPGEGDWQPDQLIVIEFPSQERLVQWAESPEYSAIKNLRERSTVTRAVTIDALTSQPA